MKLSQRKQLRALAHHLHPIVLIGQSGLTEAVLAAIEQALDDHELIKIKIRSDDRDARRAIGAAICAHTRALPVQTIGQICVLYRKNPAKHITTPAPRPRTTAKPRVARQQSRIRYSARR